MKLANSLVSSDMAALGGLVGRFLPRPLEMLDTTVLGIGELGALFLVLASHGSRCELTKQELRKGGWLVKREKNERDEGGTG